MKNKAHDIGTYQFREGEPLLLDANVWLYLQPPPSRPHGQTPASVDEYSKALKSMLQARTRLLLDVLVLSEYLNAYCRIIWGASHKAAHPEYKTFRKKPVFLPVGQQAAAEARRILKICARENCPFRDVNIDQILAGFEAGGMDCNDGVLIETCRLNGWKFVTHDGDCSEGGIEILTSNCGLLRNCP